MRLATLFQALLAAQVCRVIAGTLQQINKQTNNGDAATILSNYDGWVNPEDLAPMPQCIAQQDQSTWTASMTKCTQRRCTSHFGLICTHQQWLTQLSCLSREFSGERIRNYVPYCSRSILAKTQLYHWIRNITGRTWLVDVGDANGLQTISPKSLAGGYEMMDVVYSAPSCLTNSFSTSTNSFQQALGSCSFTGVAEQTGNAARPWEYSGSLKSIVALGFETAAYTLTGGRVEYGDYFDKGCFCNSFGVSPEQSSCSGIEQIDWTRERLWLNATCGPTSLPSNWAQSLKLLGFSYVPIDNWRWPQRLADMPKQLKGLGDHCTTSACDVGLNGYCKLRGAIDRGCVCRDSSYELCEGLCQVFETRIEYVNWLHSVCSGLPEWHGLPGDWRWLASPSTTEMIPWSWAITPPNNTYKTPVSDLRNATWQCPSGSQKIGSLALISVVAGLGIPLRPGDGSDLGVRDIPWHPYSRHWITRGISIAAVQLSSHYWNGLIVQATLGDRSVPVIQLILLWCSMPRLNWLGGSRISALQFRATNTSAFGGFLLSEVILQVLTLYSMLITVNYGREHNLYLRSLQHSEREPSARLMYIGALTWLVVFLMEMLALGFEVNRWAKEKPITTVFGDLYGLSGLRWTMFNKTPAYSGIHKANSTEGRPLLSSGRGDCTTYGTSKIENKIHWGCQKTVARFHLILAMSLPVLYALQWLFWVGFIGLSLETYCLPHLWPLTVIWAFASWVSVRLG